MKKNFSNMMNLVSAIRVKVLCLATLSLFVGANNEVWGQTNKEYYSKNDGNWSVSANWKSKTPTADPASECPGQISFTNTYGTYGDAKVNINHNITIDEDAVGYDGVNLNVRQITLKSGVNLYVNRNFAVTGSGGIGECFVNNGGNITISSDAELHIQKTLKANADFSVSGAGTLKLKTNLAETGKFTTSVANVIFTNETGDGIANISNPIVIEGGNVLYQQTKGRTLSNVTITGTESVSGTFTAEANVTITNLTIDGGTLTIKTGKTVTITNLSVTKNSRIIVDGDGTATLAVTNLTINPDVTLETEGNLTWNKAVTLSTGHIESASGTLTFSNTVTLGSDYTLTGAGGYSISGTINTSTYSLKTESPVSLTGSGASANIVVDNNMFTNNKNPNTINSLIVNEGGSFVANYNTTINNLTLDGGELEIASGKKLTATESSIQVGGSATITSFGSGVATIKTNEINVVSGSTLTIDGTNFSEDFPITINGGLKISGNVTASNNITVNGEVEIDNGATLNIADSKNLTFLGTPNISGAGTLNFKGTATINNLTDCLGVEHITFGGNKKTITYGGTSDHIIAATNYNNLVISSTADSLTLCGNVTVNNNFTINNDYKLGGDGTKLTVKEYFYGNSKWFKTYVDVTVCEANREKRIVGGKIEVNEGTFLTFSRPENPNDNNDIAVPIEELIINGGKFETARSLIVSTPIVLNGGELKTKYKVQSPTPAINVTKSSTITTSFQAYDAAINISEGAILSVATYTVENKNYADFSNKVAGAGTIKVTNGSTLKLNDDEIGGLIVDNGGILEIARNMDVTGNATFAGTVNGAYTITVKGTEVTFDSPTFGTNNKVLIDGNAKIIGANDCFTGYVSVANNKNITYAASSNKILALADASGSYGSLTIEGTVVELCADAEVGGTFAVKDDLSISGSGKTLTINGDIEDESGAAEKKTITINSGATLAVGAGASSVEPKISVPDGATLNYGSEADLTALNLAQNGNAVFEASARLVNPTLDGNITVRADETLTLAGTVTIGSNLHITKETGANVVIGNGATIVGVIPCDLGISVADGASVEYASTSTNILGGTYTALTINGSNVTLCDNVTVNGGFAIAGNTTINSSNKSLTLNNAVNSEDGNTLTINGTDLTIGAGTVDATVQPYLTLTSGATLTYNRTTALNNLNVGTDCSATFGATTTASNATLNGEITVNSGKTLTLATTVDFAGAAISGEGAVNVKEGATISNLTSCLSVGIEAAGEGENRTITYATTSNKILSGTYTNLTIQGSEVTLCDDVTVDGTFAIGGNTTISSSNKSLTLNNAVNSEDGSTLTISGTDLTIDEETDDATVQPYLTLTSGAALTYNRTTALSNLNVGTGCSATFAATATASNATLNGDITVNSGETLTLTESVDFEGASISSGSSVNVKEGATISNLTACLSVGIAAAGEGEDQTITYASTSNKILTGTYTNLSISSSSVELCNNVTVEGTFAVGADVTITGGRTLTLKNEVTGGKAITASGTTAIVLTDDNNSDVAASFVLNAGTSLTSNRACEIAAITVDGGSATIGAATTVTGNFAVNSGSATINAVTITASNFNVGGNGTVTVTGASRVTGNANLTGTIDLSADGASFTVGGGTIAIPAISSISDVSKFHIDGTSTIAELDECVDGLDISGNITYAASAPVIQVSDAYSALTILGTDVSLCGDVTVSGTLTWNSGIITLGSNTLTVANISSENEFGGAHMMVSGGLDDAAGRLTITDLTGSVVFPVGTMLAEGASRAQYTPVTFSSIAAGASSSITVSTDNHTAAGGIAQDLKRTWNVSSSNVDGAKLDFEFVAVDDPTHLAMLVALNGEELTGSSVDNENKTMTTNVVESDINGTWTAVLSGRFIYSYQNGDWNVDATWTDKPDGSEPDGGVGSVSAPMSTDNVTILSGHIVEAGSAAQYANTVNVLGELDLGTQETHFKYLSGTGRLIQTGTYNVGVDCHDADFRAADGGTLELNGDFSGQSDFRFNNLILNNNSGENLALTIGADKGTMNGSLTLEGANSITINGNLATATTGTISVETTSTFAGNVTTGGITVGEDKQLTISGDYTVSATSITATATDAKVVVDGDATVATNAVLTGAIEVNSGKTLTVEGTGTGTDVTFSGSGRVVLKTGETYNGTITAEQLEIEAGAIVNANLIVTGSLAIADGAEINGTVEVGVAGTPGSLTLGSNVEFNETVAVIGNIVASANDKTGVSFNSTVSATNITLGNGAAFEGAVTLGGNLTLGASAAISSTAAITGDATFGDNATITGSTISAANLIFGSGASVGAAITTTDLAIGGGTLGAATISGEMTLGGNVTVDNGAVTVTGKLALASNTLIINGINGVVNANGALTFSGATVSGTGAIHINNTLSSDAAITLNVATADLIGSNDISATTTITVGSGATLTNKREDKTITGLTVNGKFVSNPGVTLANMTVNDGGEVELNGVTTMTGLAMSGSTSKLTAAADVTITGTLSGTVTAGTDAQINLSENITFTENIEYLIGDFVGTNPLLINGLAKCVSNEESPYTFTPGIKTVYKTSSFILSAVYTDLQTYCDEITLCSDIIVNRDFMPTTNDPVTIHGGGKSFTAKRKVTGGRHFVFDNVNVTIGGVANSDISVKSIDINGSNKLIFAGDVNIISNAVTFKGDGEIVINNGAAVTTEKNITFEKNQVISGEGSLTINTTTLTAPKITNYATINIGTSATVNVNEFDIKNGGTLDYINATKINKITVNTGANFIAGQNVTVDDMTLTGGKTQLADNVTLTMKSGVDMAISGNDTIIGGTGSAISGKLALAESINLSISGSVALDNKLQIANNVTLTGIGDAATMSWSANEEVEVASGKHLTINGDLKFEGDITLNGAIKVVGTSNKLKLGGGTVTFNSATDFSGTNGKLVFVDDATISGLSQNPNIAYANVECVDGKTVTYAANCTRMLPGSYSNVGLNGAIADITLLDDVEVRGTLTWTAGRIHLGAKKLTISQNDLPGTFSPTFMVVVGDGGRLVYKAPAATTTLKMPVGTIAQNNMGASVYQYTPVSFSGLTTIAAGDTVLVQVKNQPKTGKASDLRRYWTVRSKSGAQGTLVFNYNTDDDPYNHVRYLKVYRYGFDDAEDGIIADGATDDVAKTISVSNIIINGIWSAIEFPPVVTLYSFKNGRWWDPEVWTTSSTGTIYDNPLGLTPTEDHDVVILHNNEIEGGSADDDNANAHTNIHARSVFLDGFDTKLIVNSENDVDINVMKGNGTLQLKDICSFPEIRHPDLFMAADGGTTEFCGSPVADEFDLEQAEFNNLSISYTKSDMKLDIKPKGENGSPINKLQINGNLTITNGALVYKDAGKSIHVEGDVVIGGNGKIINNSGVGDVDNADTLQIAGNFSNSGEVLLTKRTWDSYTSLAPAAEGTNGRGILRFVGTGNSAFDCYSTTNISQIIVDKANEELAVVLKTYSDEQNFGLLGQAVNTKAPAGFETEGAYPENPTEYFKPLWLKCGILELQGLTHIRSLAEEGVAAKNKDCFFIPQKGCLRMNGPLVKVESTISSAAKVAYSSIIPAGRFIIDDGTYDGKGGSGATFVGSTHIEINGGTVKWASFRPSQFSYNGQTSYTQTGGHVYITGLGDAVGSSASFFMPLSSYIFNMSGGTLEIWSAGNEGAFVVKSNPTDGGITGGDIIINTGKFDNGSGTDGSSSNYKISSELPFHNLILKNEKLNGGTAVYESHYLSDASGNWKSKIAYSIKANTVIKNDLIIETGVVFDTKDKAVTVGRDLIIRGGNPLTAAKVYTRSGTFIMTGDSPSIDNGAHLIADGIIVADNSASPAEGFYNLTIAEGADITADNSFKVRNKFILGNNAKLRDGNDNNIYTMLRHVEIDGEHIERATGPATMLLNCGTDGILYSNGNGVLNNVTINTTQGTLKFQDPVNNNRATKLTINGQLDFASATRFYIGIHNLELGPNAEVVATVSSGFGPDCMIQTYGPSASALGVTKVYNAGHKSFTFPFGFQSSNYYYTPATIEVGNAETYGKITSRPVTGSNFRVANKSLKCYWITEETGFVNAVNRSQEYKWYSNWISNDAAPVGYVGARRTGGTWDTTFGNVESSTTGGLTEWKVSFSRDDITSVNGYYTAGKPEAFTNMQVLYSSDFVNDNPDAEWSDSRCWSTLGVGMPAADPAVLPTGTTAVIIGDETHHHTIKATGNISSSSLSIAPGSTLDLGVYNGSFGIAEVDEAIGAGTIKIARDYFPGGDYVSFLGEHGGTVEYYGAGDFILTKAQNTYCNLVISAGTDENHPITMPQKAITVFNNLTIKGWAQSDTAAARTLTVNDSLIVESGGLLLRNNKFTNKKQTYTVKGSVVVNSGATIKAAGLSEVDIADANMNKLLIYGNLTVDGTFDATTGYNKFDTEFTGETTSVVSGNSSIDFNRFICNKDHLADSLILETNNVTSAGDAKADLKRGLFAVRIGANNELLFSENEITIPQSVQLAVVSGKVWTLKGTSTAQKLILYGRISIEDEGYLVVGRTELTTRYNSIVYAAEGKPSISINGGKLEVAGQISMYDGQTTGSLVWNQTGGEVVINGKHREDGPDWLSSFGAFHIQDAGEFNMSGGTLTIMNGGGGELCGDIYIKPTAGSVNCTGGEIIIGGGSQKLLTNSPLYNLKVASGATLSAYDNINVNRLTIEGSGVYNALTRDLVIRGEFINHNNNSTEGSTISQGFVAGSATQLTKFVGENVRVEGVAGYQTQFARLEIDGDVDLEAGKTSIRIGGNLVQNGGTVDDHGNIIHLFGDLTCRGSFEGEGGINFCRSDDKQTIDGNTLCYISTITVSNNHEVYLNTNIRVHNKVKLDANLFIDRCRLYLDEDATIEAVPGEVLSASRMIRMNGMYEDHGVTKYVPYSEDTPFSFIIPVGVDDADGVGRYTPAKYEFEFNKIRDASITVATMNFRHQNLSVEPTKCINYYWKVVTDGFGDDGDEFETSKSDEYSVKQTYTYDCVVHGSGEEPMLPEYLYYGGAEEYEWMDFTGDATTPAKARVVGNDIEFDHFGHIKGDYTAGAYGESIYNAQPVLYTSDACAYEGGAAGGEWSAPGTWMRWDKTANDGAGGLVPYNDAPDGNPIHIQPGHKVYVSGPAPVTAYCIIFDEARKLTPSETIETKGLGIFDIGSTQGSKFGRVDGAGWLVIWPNADEYKMPAGDFEGYLSDTKSIIEFTGSANGKLPNSIVGHASQPMQNVILSGTGVKTLTKETGEYINGNMTIRNGARLAFNNTPIYIKGNWIDENTSISGFDAGSSETKSLVEFNGTTEQTITLANDQMSFYRLKISNPAGVQIVRSNETGVPDSTPLTIVKELIFTNGCLTTADNSSVVIGYGTTISGYGQTMFVNGPLTKMMHANDNFTFPVGKIDDEGDKFYAPATLTSVTEEGAWTTTYYYDADSRMSFDSLPPLSSVSHNEYWMFGTPAASAEAKVALYATDRSIDNCTDALFNRLMVTGLINDGANADKWEMINSTRSGSTLSAYVTTSAKVAISDYTRYALGYVGITARLAESPALTICDGDAADGIPIIFNGLSDHYTVEFKVQSLDDEYTGRVDIRDGNNLTFTGNDLGRFFGRNGGFISTGSGDDEEPVPYQVSLLNVWEGNTQGQASGSNTVTVAYNALPVITGSRFVGVGETRDYEVDVTRWDADANAYTWSATGTNASKATIDPTNAAETHVTFDFNNRQNYNLNLNVLKTYNTNGKQCTRGNTKFVEVKNKPQPEIHCTTTNDVFAACKASVPSTDDDIYVYQTAFVDGHGYEWTYASDAVESAVVDEEHSPNQIAIKWKNGFAGSSATLSVTESVTYSYTPDGSETPLEEDVETTASQSINLYGSIDFDGEISALPVCDGNNGTVHLSTSNSNLKYTLLDNQDNAISSENSGYNGSALTLTTNSALTYTSGGSNSVQYKVRIRNSGCSRMFDDNQMTVRQNPSLTIGAVSNDDLYTGNLAQLTWSANNSVTPFNYSFAYSTDGVTYLGGTPNNFDGDFVGSRTIKIEVPDAENYKLKGQLTINDNGAGGTTCSADYEVESSATISGDYLWKGQKSRDWTDGENWWRGLPPTNSQNAVVRGGKMVTVNNGTNDSDNDEDDILMPQISEDTAVNDIKIGSGATVTVNPTNTFTIHGDVDCAGEFTGEGTVAFNNGVHTISGDSPKFVNLTNEGTVSAAHDITVTGNINNAGIFTGSTANVILEGGSMQIDGEGQFKNVKVSVGSGNFVTVKGNQIINGTMTLSSGLVKVDDGKRIKFSAIGGDMDKTGNSWIVGEVEKSWPSDNKEAFSFYVGGDARLAQLDVEPDDVEATFTVKYTCNDAITDPITTGFETESLRRVSGKEKWNINGVKPDGDAQSSTLTFHWADDDASGIKYDVEEGAPTLVVAHENEEGKWEIVPGASVSYLNKTISVDVDSYSYYTFGTTSVSADIHPLPVTFTAFSGRQEGNSIVLEWATMSEKDNDYFEIERSIDGVNFVTIGYVDGAGDSDRRIDYTFSDNAPEQGWLYYRLSQVDFDGTRAYADKVISVQYTGDEFAQLTIVPNPTDGRFRVSATGSMAGGVVQLLSQTGNVVRTVNIDSFDATIDISDLPSGIYVLRFVTDSKILQQKVVKY